MVGKDMTGSFFHEHNQEIGEEMLRVEDVILPRLGGGYTLDRVSFSLRQGEILGIYGLMGAGRSELLECLTGLHPEAKGKMWLEGQALKKSDTVTERIGLGLALIPEDRQREGLVQTMSVAENMLLASLKKYLNVFYLSDKKEKENVDTLINDLSLKVSDPGQIYHFIEWRQSAKSGGGQGAAD